MKAVNGSEWMSADQLCISFPHHPETSGAIEWWHSTLKAMSQVRKRSDWLGSPFAYVAVCLQRCSSWGYSFYTISFNLWAYFTRTTEYNQRTMGRDGKLVAEYLSNFYEHMENTTKLASERIDEAKMKYWYNRSTTEHSFEVRVYMLICWSNG